MVRYHINDIKEDMVLGQAISLPTGKMLLNAGQRITDQYRKRLKSLGIKTLLINTPGTETVHPKSIVSEESVSALSNSVEEAEEKINTILNKFQGDISKNMHKFLFEKRKDLNKFIMNPTIAKQINTIIQEIFDETEIVLNMATLNKTETSLFQSALDVAITSLCIGRKHNFSYEETKQLGIGALNYHIGMIAVPKEIREKTEKLSEEEEKIYRQHTAYGYLMLSQNYNIPATSSIIALQHHELQNGEGYPLGLRGTNRPPMKDITQIGVIHRFAEIVIVADMYHNLIWGSSTDDYRKVKNALSKLIKLSGTFLNREIVKTLTSIVPVYPIGTRVRITEAPKAQLKKYIGVVAEDNPHNLSKPKILLYETMNRKRINPPIKIDTAKVSGIEFEILL